ncbi:pullulanase [Mycolicibacterium brumae]|uniref:Pullulanase n=1 Tax=Mycolicibacterium brumae TaxID=85968 RepID=A0A2G5P604_9MYCO|nr:pullulanase [Mycolicibacterium brumae]MCV7192174.1 pullulanase [Mycolicibacterium brumae]PIB73334.1 pullulanase [Mycolicibacterium brumae]RWA21234.1 hypothetical protein MBRU_14905 [Mycolicibacterium brumae DSM 44177]UWW10693.1 pullulanase [Mycolicibacterium brumae]
MEYCLGPGDGTASVFDSPMDLDIDGDGVFDAVGLDFDGDGASDDALADLDGDGTADHVVLDAGSPDQRWFTDDGTGVWALAADPVGRGSPLRWLALDGAEHTGSPADFDGDGLADDEFFDDNGDGLADRVLSRAPAGGYDGGYVDVDGDGRWDVRLVDADGDGRADGASPLSDPGPEGPRTPGR